MPAPIAQLKLTQGQPMDGALESIQSCTPARLTYAQYLRHYRSQMERECATALEQGIQMPTGEDLLKAAIPEIEYIARTSADAECFRIQYWSDGLRVAGYVFKPARVSSGLPAIVWNRGGHGELGLVRPEHLWTRFSTFLSAGYVVLASQYRGNDGSEGHDEFGGRDVADVMNLITLASQLSYVDSANLHLLGESRGAMMVLLALRHQARVRSAVTWSPLLDLVAESVKRPGMRVEVFERLIPGVIDGDEEPLRQRSAVYWPECIDTPLLILQGACDWRVSADLATTFARQLERSSKEVKFVLYDGDHHGLPLNAQDRDAQTLAWFNAHRAE